MTQQVVYVNEFNPCIDFFQGQPSYFLSKESFSCLEGERELIHKFSGKLLDYVKNVAEILEGKDDVEEYITALSSTDTVKPRKEKPTFQRISLPLVLN